MAELNILLQKVINESSVEITGVQSSQFEISKVINDIIVTTLKDLLPNENQPGNSVSNNNSNGNSSDSQISVQAVIKYIESRMQSQFSMNIIGAQESASVQTEVNLRTDKINDVDILEKKIMAGNGAPQLGFNINAGESISISTAYWYIEKTEHKMIRKFLTLSELNSLKLDIDQFSKVHDENCLISDIKVNENRFAQGVCTPSFLNGLKNVYPFWYRWVYTKYESSVKKSNSGVYSSGIESFQSMPLQVSFSGINERRSFTFAELIQDNDYWSAFYNHFSGKLILTARQNLGAVRIYEKMLAYDKKLLAEGKIRKEDLSFIEEIPKSNLINSSFNDNSIPTDFVTEYKYSSYSEKPTINEIQVFKSVPSRVISQKTIGLIFTRPKVIPPNELQMMRYQSNQFLQINQKN